MSDVAQILGLAAPAAAASSAVNNELEKLKPASSSSSSAVAKSKQRKPSGMRREVLELLESTHRASHALLPGLSALSLQQKWRQRRAIPAVKWCVHSGLLSFCTAGVWEADASCMDADMQAPTAVP